MAKLPLLSHLLWALKLLLLASLLVLLCFYAASFFSGGELPQATRGYSGNASGWLPNEIGLLLRPDPLRIPSRGVNICPGSFTEHIPCHDQHYIDSISSSLNFSKRENLERHCPPPEARPFCLVPVPKGYKLPIPWPESRNFVWRSNANHTRLAEVKGGQNWVHVNGSRMWFPGGGTHFKHGAPEYIQRLGSMVTNWTGDFLTAGIAQVLDVGCGVASFAAYLMPLHIETMSFAPLDGHENQIQFALERGIPAMIGVLGTRRLPYPSKSFDAVHCSRCRVDWHEDGGILLKEVDRLLRPGGYFIYSAPPAYKKVKEFPAIWSVLTNLTTSMCWELIAQHVQTAVWKKAADRRCQLKRAPSTVHLCDASVDLDKSWNKPLDDCIAVSAEDEKPSRLLPWPARLLAYPKRLGTAGVTLSSFQAEASEWQTYVEVYWKLMNLSSENSIRNVMDMNAIHGHFAVALRNKPVWVMNVVPSSSLGNTLGVIYDRGLVGTFHDWCESFSSYPRSYDLLHAYKLLSSLVEKGKGCELADIMLEMDRLLRPNGVAIFVDKPSVIQEVLRLSPKFLWTAQLHADVPQLEGGLLICRKQFWVVE